MFFSKNFKIRRSAFTLIELLVVIAIIAILSIFVIITLNPAELTRQSRDADRLSDLDTIDHAVSIYASDQSSASNFSLGSQGVTYLSIPDPTATTSAATDCSALGFPSGGSFHCAASSTYRNTDGTGWIPVNLKNISSGSPLGNLPVDPSNQTSSDLYYGYQTNGTTFKIFAAPESQKYITQVIATPSLFQNGSNINLSGGPNWVPVPGNTTFGTGNFWVMKYPADCSNGKGSYLNDYPSIWATYDAYLGPCTLANGARVISSLPGGFPVTDLAQATATLYCNAIGAHLLTNNEWQTIAWNLENVPSNWSSSTVGGGYMYSGHNDNVPAMASPADPNDANGYAGTDGPISGGGTGAGGTAAQTQRRTLTLSNGGVLWDMSGNVSEWTNTNLLGSGQPNSGAGAFANHEYTAITSWGTMSQQTMGPANSTWNSTQGIGQVNSEGSSTDSLAYVIMRSSYWGNLLPFSGIESAFLATNPTWGGNTSIGFRCAR